MFRMLCVVDEFTREALDGPPYLDCASPMQGQSETAVILRRATWK